MVKGSTLSRRLGRVAGLFGGGLAVFLLAAGTEAQTGTVTGTVIDRSTNQPLNGVQVSIVGTQRGGLTDGRGRFLVVQVPAGAQQVQAVFIGYRTESKPVTVTADYTSAGVMRTASTTVMIADLSVVTVMEPKNVNVSGPLTESPSLPICLAWDLVVGYTDGTPIPAGTIVDYSAYWTTDSTLSESSLNPLASSIRSTSVYFDPTAQGMKHNQRVYFTTRAKDTTGKQSRLSASVPWKVSNTGPSTPRNVRIKKN